MYSLSSAVSVVLLRYPISAYDKATKGWKTVGILKKKEHEKYIILCGRQLRK